MPSHTPRPRGKRRSRVWSLPAALVLLAASVGAALRALRGCNFAAAGAVQRRPSSIAGRASKVVASAWQQRLDRALLDVDTKPQARVRNLQRVQQDLGAVLSDVSRAVGAIRDRGFRDGHVEAIDALWPKGTLARSDIEGLQALRKQIPEIVQDLQSMGVSGAPDAGSSSGAARPRLADIASGILDLATDGKKREEALEEARNVFRRVPKGLETPSYQVVRVLGLGSRAVELRRYAPFVVARRSMPNGNGTGFASGQGFTKLAGYLFGNNSESVAMEMTAPVEISYDGSDEASMAFVLPRAYADEPPLPEGDDIEVVQVPERLVAVKAFPGVVTEGEVQRQRAALAEVLVAEDAPRQVNASEYSVLQYNPPYTLPWRRLNELAVVVEPVPATAPAVETPAEDSEAQAAEALPAEAGEQRLRAAEGGMSDLEN